MVQVIHRKTLIDFYDNLNEKSPIMIMLMMVFTFGFYLINWIYRTNQLFEYFDNDNSPDSARGLVILFMMPMIWLIIMFIFKVIIFPEFNSILYYVNIIGWFFIVFLALQYFYDFCLCFGKFTMSNGYVWYMFFWIGFFPIVLFSFNNYYFIPILFFPIVTVPAMQAKLNSLKQTFERNKSNESFYEFSKKN